MKSTLYIRQAILVLLLVTNLAFIGGAHPTAHYSTSYHSMQSPNGDITIQNYFSYPTKNNQTNEEGIAFEVKFIAYNLAGVDSKMVVWAGKDIGTIFYFRPEYKGKQYTATLFVSRAEAKTVKSNCLQIQWRRVNNDSLINKLTVLGCD